MSVKKTKAFAPASVANVAVGFDLLGFSFGAVGDTVELEWNPSGEHGVVVESIQSTAAHIDTSKIPTDSLRNTAAVSAQAMMNALSLDGQIKLKIKKGIPLSSGMGGSAASAVASVVALNGLIEKPADWKDLLKYALEGERIASGAIHLDNVLPCLRGGLNLVAAPEQYIQCKVPPDLLCVLVHPNIEVQTRYARSVLSEQIPLKAHIQQSGYLAGFLAGCASADWSLIEATLRDVIIEPQRQKLIPGFLAAKEAAMKAGALGFSISGSGPTVFALVNDKKKAQSVATVVTEVFQSLDIPSQNWSGPVLSSGAKIL